MAILEFGPFRLDTDGEILFLGAEPTALGKRAVALLRRLIEQAGTPVSKDVLIGAAWPGLAIEDSNLTVQIAALRRVLDAAAGGATWIETLPRRGYRYVGPSAAAGHLPAEANLQTPPAFALPDKPSIAVLPFQNLSGDPAQDYFADGMVEEIITALSRIRWLIVIARNSTYTYKGRAVDVKQVGRELGVRYVLEGSLRKAGDRIRITGQLVETHSGAHVWAERYDRALGDIFELQDEITLSVIGAIEPSLREAEIERAKRKRPENLDAYDLYLRALPHAYVPMPAEADKGIDLLKRSLALEPDYPAAHATTAWCYEIRYLRGGLHETDKKAALDHAHSAIAAGPDDAATLATAGFVIGLVAHDYKTAMEIIDRALTLTGASSVALWMGATVLAHAGEGTKAIDYAQRSLRLTPFGRERALSHIALAIAHLVSGDFAMAETAAANAAQTNARFSFAHVLHCAALCGLGRLDEAKAAAGRVLECEPDFTVATFVRSHTGRADIWNPIGEALRQVGLPK